MGTEPTQSLREALNAVRSSCTKVVRPALAAGEPIATAVGVKPSATGVLDGATVTLDQQDAKLTLKAGKSRFNLQTLPAEDFPLLSVGAEPLSKLTVPQKALKALLAKVQYAMAVQDIRYYLNGMLFIAEGNQLKLVATDGHRLAFACMTLDAEVARAEADRKSVV